MLSHSNAIHAIEISSYNIGSCLLEIWLDLVYNVAHESTIDMDHLKKVYVLLYPKEVESLINEPSHWYGAFYICLFTQVHYALKLSN